MNRPRRVALASVAGAFVLSAFACASLEGLSTGGATGESDAASLDATTASDAPVVAVDGATRRGGCGAGPFRYCDDFDGRSSPEGGPIGWGTSVDPSATLALSAEAWSSPSSVEARSGSSDAGDAGTSARIDRGLTLAGTTVRVEMEMRIDVGTEGWSNPVARADLARIVAGPGAFYRLQVAQDGVYLHAMIAVPPTPIERTVRLDPFPLGSWQHVDIEIALAPIAGTVRVTVGGKIVLDQKGVRTVADPNPTLLQVQLGVQTDAITPSLTARFDDVKIY